MSKMSKKQHVPAPGRAVGLKGRALCGRYAQYRTGDHALIRQVARQSDGEGYCTRCLARVS